MIPPLPPSRVRSGFYTEAGRACARYVQNGGQLREIRMDETQLLQNPLQLTPAPLGKREPFPSREILEEDLINLHAGWCGSNGTSIRSAFRFLLSFCREMEKTGGGWHDWARVWMVKQQIDHQSFVQQKYYQLLDVPKGSKKPFYASWPPHPDIDPKVLYGIFEEALTKGAPELSHSKRAIVIQTELLGTAVIIKRYASNPSNWKQRWEVSRARRAWAASQILEEIHLPGIRGLGWLEHYDQDKLKDSFFISHQLPDKETLRAWLRREFPKMSKTERIQFRHRLRQEIFKLHQHGLSHVDLKLTNILVSGKEVDDLVFYWIDLEDIRPRKMNTRTFIRNLYQLNGSLPRQIPLEDRKAFVYGFRKAFPFTNSRHLLKYIQHKTRKRHQDELKRLQGA